MVETKPQKKNEILEKDCEALEECKEESKENKEKILTEQLQRLQAEFENFQKRTEKEKIQIRETANENTISNLLPILDNFELSLKHNKDEGVKLIYKDLIKTLKAQGLKKIDTNIPFDPKFHEALLQEDGKEDGKITEELQKGYTLNNKLLRASKVKITKKSSK